MLDLNYFELLDVEPGVSLDEGELTKRAKALKNKFHPDRFSNGLASEQTHALQITAQIEAARSQLSCPTQRMIYLLELQGYHYTPERHGKLASGFLMQQMERKAQLASVLEAGENPVEALQELLDTVKKEFDSIFESCRRHEAALLGRVPLESRIAEIYEDISRLMFLDRLYDEIQTHLNNKCSAE